PRVVPHAPRLRPVPLVRRPVHPDELLRGRAPRGDRGRPARRAQPGDRRVRVGGAGAAGREAVRADRLRGRPPPPHPATAEGDVKRALGLLLLCAVAGLATFALLLDEPSAPAAGGVRVRGPAVEAGAATPVASLEPSPR